MFKLSSYVFSLSALFLLLSCGTETPDNTTTDTNTEVEQAPLTPTDFGGLALYTLRDTMAGDPEAVLQEVADLGYAYVEAAGWKDGKFYGMTPAAFKAYLDKVGLTPISSHMSGATLDNLDQMIADVKAAGFQYFVIPVPPMGAFTFDAATRTLGMNKSAEAVMTDINLIAQRCADAGLKCLYHNHDFEFMAEEGDMAPIEYFLENSDPDILNFQMDLYWVTKAGADPVEYFNRYPGRFIAWHVKDMDDEGRFAPVGEGNIDFRRILDAKDKSGMEFYLVEQDICFKHQPLEAIKISHKALGEIGFE